MRTNTTRRSTLPYDEVRNRESGFTLIELLVVVAIIGVLAGLTLPVVNLCIRAGQATKCVGNLKAIGAGLHAYITDNGGDLPPCVSLPNGTLPNGAAYKISYRQKTYWFDALNPYMGYPQYAANRSTNFPAPESVGTEFPFAWQLCPAKKTTPLQRQTVGYGWNCLNFGIDGSRSSVPQESAKPNPPGYGFGTRIMEITEPGRTIIIGDSKDADVQPESPSQDRNIYDYDGEKKVPYPTRHGSDGGNYLFLDGHVAWFSAKQMMTTEVTKLFKKIK